VSFPHSSLFVVCLLALASITRPDSERISLMALDTDADDEIGHASPNPFEIQEATEHLPAPAAAPSSSNSSTGSRRWLNKRVKTLIILLLSFGVLLGLIFIIVIPINSESSGTTRKYYIAAETEVRAALPLALALALALSGWLAGSLAAYVTPHGVCRRARSCCGTMRRRSTTWLAGGRGRHSRSATCR